jgi:hypothetical protein
MHFLMKRAVISIACDGLPALSVFTSIISSFFLLVLPKIKSFLREKFRADRLRKIVIRDLAIFVAVELIK